MNDLTWADFEKVEMRVGTITAVKDFPNARNPSYKLCIDFGVEIGIKKSSAQITQLYSKEDLIGKQVVAVINFPPKQIADFMSECLILGAMNGSEVTLLKPDSYVEKGSRVG